MLVGVFSDGGPVVWETGGVSWFWRGWLTWGRMESPGFLLAGRTVVRRGWSPVDARRFARGVGGGVEPETGGVSGFWMDGGFRVLSR